MAQVVQVLQTQPVTMVMRPCFQPLHQRAEVRAVTAVIMVLLVAQAAAVVRVGQATLQAVQEHRGKVLQVGRVALITPPIEMQVAEAVLAQWVDVRAQAALLVQSAAVAYLTQ